MDWLGTVTVALGAFNGSSGRMVGFSCRQSSHCYSFLVQVIYLEEIYIYDESIRLDSISQEPNQVQSPFAKMADTKIHMENIEVVDDLAKHDEESPQPTEELRRLDRETLRRLDLLLMPMTLMLYLLAWLDRANVGNARVVSRMKVHI